MKKIRLIIACFILLIKAIQLNAQSGIVAVGGDVSASSGSLSYSVGQIDYEVVSNSNGTLIQGLQQPFENL